MEGGGLFNPVNQPFVTSKWLNVPSGPNPIFRLVGGGGSGPISDHGDGEEGQRQRRRQRRAAHENASVVAAGSPNGRGAGIDERRAACQVALVQTPPLEVDQRQHAIAAIAVKGRGENVEIMETSEQFLRF